MTQLTYTAGQRISATVFGKQHTGTITHVGESGYTVQLDDGRFDGYWVYEHEITGLVSDGVIGDDELLTAAAVGLADETTTTDEAQS